MTTYSYSQLESLWEQAGGSSTLAPVMAAIALAESSGNPQAENPSGASGLWQVMVPENNQYIPGGSSNVFNPQDNASAAVAIEKAQGLSAWTTYTSGAYEQFLQSGVAPSPAGTTETSGTGMGTSGTSPDLSGLSLDSIATSVSGLFRDIAVVLDYFFGMFGRGQGWRIAFTAITVVLVFAAWKCLATSGTVPEMSVPHAGI